MSDSPDSPAWDFLPHDPVRFFRLDDSFDRKDLKRAYNKLLRQFKPEKFPQEFQRIRAAYEELDEELRYHGGAARQRIPVPQDWKTDETPVDDRSAAATPQPETPRRRRLVDRLADESPQLLFRELTEKENKTPYDYYALALLSDLVEKSSVGFAKWLIKGIAAHRDDGALRQLLHDYFRGPQKGKHLLKLLPAVAEAVRTDEFYPLTEPAWQVVLRECSFGDFTDTFAACERQLRDPHIIGRMAFLIQILKSAMWCESESGGINWSAQQFDFIEANFENIPPWLEWDVDILGMARDYMAVRQRFIAGSSLRRRLDAALRDYFCEPQEVGDRSVVARQMEILADSEELLEAFPVEEADIFSQFYPIWAWASHDVAERHSIEQETEFNDNIWTTRAEALLTRCEKSCNNSRTGVMWSLCDFLRFGALAIIGFVAMMMGFAVSIFIMALLEPLWGLKAIDYGWFFAAVVAGTCALVVPWKLKSIVDEKYWFPLFRKYAAKCYRKLWRRELLDFQRRSHVPEQFFRAVFAHFAGKNAICTWVNSFVQQDYAPALLARAQRFEA